MFKSLNVVLCLNVIINNSTLSIYSIYTNLLISACSYSVVIVLVAGSGSKMLQAMPEQWLNLWQALNHVNMYCHPETQQPVLLSLFMMVVTCTVKCQGITQSGICFHHF